MVHHFWPSVSRLSPSLSHTELSWASGFAQGHFQKPQGGGGAMRGQVPHTGTGSSYCYRATVSGLAWGTGLSRWFWAFPRDPMDLRSQCCTGKAQQKTLNTLLHVDLTGHSLLDWRLPLCRLPPGWDLAEGCTESWQGLGAGDECEDGEEKAL